MEDSKRIKSYTRNLRNKLKYQLSIQRPSLSNLGLLNLSGLDITSLEDMGTQKNLRTLDISGTPIESLESLPAQPNLQQLVADGTRVNTFAGLCRHPKLRSVSLQRTPISETENFRLSLLVLVGQMLAVINGTPVRPSERVAAAKYPIIARMLLEAGWQIEVPPPGKDEMRELALDYNIRVKGVDPEFSSDESKKYLDPPPQLVPIDTKEFESESEEDINEFSQEVDLQNALYEKLHTIGITVNKGPNMQREIVEAVKGLADLVKGFEGCYKEVFQLNDNEDDEDENQEK